MPPILLPVEKRRGVTRSLGAAVRLLALAGCAAALGGCYFPDNVAGSPAAFDYRLPGGLSAVELRHVLRAAAASGRLAGLEVTIYNPALDTDGSAGRALTDMLVAALGTSAGWGA